MPADATAQQPSPVVGLRAVARFSRGERGRLGLAVLALLASALFLYAVPLIPQAVLDLVLGDGAKASWISQRIADAFGGPSAMRDALWMPAAAMAALAAFSGIALHVKTRLAAGAAERVARRMRDRMYDHVQRLPSDALDAIPSGDIVQRCTSDIETLRVFLANQAPEICRAVLMLVIPLPVLVALDWRMALASVVCVPAMLLFTARYFGRMAPDFAAKETAEARMTANVQENLTGIRTVRAFGRAEHENARFAASSAAFRDSDLRLFRHYAFFWSASDLLCFAQQVIVVALGAWLLSRGSLETGAYFYFLTVVGMFIWPVRMLGRMVVESGKALAAVVRLDEILSKPEERDLDPAPAEALALAAAGGGLAIRFDRVSFAYRGGPRVLDGVSFEVEPGQTLGLVGPSGAGKTTIVQLLLRFHEPTEGSIEVDGSPLVRVPRQSIRSVVGTVLQQPFLYSKKLRDNIVAGMRADAARDARIADAARAACIHGSIEAFPEGYDTVVGEKGLTLSGGQRQRVAIARALVRAPRLLILDDALSAVDAHTESSILAALRAAPEGQTRIVVAHRLSAVMSADLILVLDGGRVVQRGTHDELAAQDGLYRTLWRIQHHDDAEISGMEAAHV
ncbi:MAG: ABC transporter ATP-binding protein [Planctomycetota bacterium]